MPFHHAQHAQRLEHNCVSTSSQLPKWIMVLMLGTSIPIPNAVVASDEGSQEDERKPPLAYVSGVSEWIRKACEKFDLRIVFKSGPTLHSLLTKVKGPLLPKEKLAGVVYQIPCQCGKVYVGETQRHLQT